MRYLFSLKVAYWSCDRLWWLQSGLGDRREHIMVQYWVSFMVLKCVVLGSVLFGSGFGSVCWDGMLLTILMGFRGSIAWFWLLVKVAQGMDLSTCCRRVVLRLVLLGIRWFLGGDVLACPVWATWLVLQSILRLLSCMRGQRKSLVNCVKERVSGVVTVSILVFLCTYLTRPIFGNEKKRCYGVSWLETSGIDFISEKFGGETVPCRFYSWQP